MFKRQSLRRLHELRCAQEEQRKVLLTAALGELRRLESALNAVKSHMTDGRALLAKSIWSGDDEARLSALEEIAGAGRLNGILGTRISAAQDAVDRFRADLLDTRLQRQQTGTLLDAIRAEHEAEQRRRTQIALDESYLLRKAAARRANVRREAGNNRDEMPGA